MEVFHISLFHMYSYNNMEVFSIKRESLGMKHTKVLYKITKFYIKLQSFTLQII